MCAAVNLLFKQFGCPTLYPSFEQDILLLNRMIAESPAITCGDFSRVEQSNLSDFVNELTLLIEKLEGQYLNPFINFSELRTISYARNVLAKIQLQRRSKLMRRQPFGILINGLPGCGKSFAAMQLATRLYQSIHGTFHDDDLIVLNEGDDFQSEFRTTHKIVIFDDLGATKVNVIPNDPFRKIIDFINNIPRTALNPNLELKGNVWIEPEIVVATTNMIIPFGSRQASNTDSILCYDAINRRFPAMISQIGYDKFALVDPTNTNSVDLSNLKGYNTYTFDELSYLLIKMYRSHYDRQTKFLELVDSSLVESIPLSKSNPLPFDIPYCSSTGYSSQAVRIFKDYFYNSLEVEDTGPLFAESEQIPIMSLFRENHPHKNIYLFLGIISPYYPPVRIDVTNPLAAVNEILSYQFSSVDEFEIFFQGFMDRYAADFTAQRP